MSGARRFLPLCILFILGFCIFTRFCLHFFMYSLLDDFNQTQVEDKIVALYCVFLSFSRQFVCDVMRYNKRKLA